jgi:hypothetical protein
MLMLGRKLVKNSNKGIFALAVSIPLLFSLMHSSLIPFYFALTLIPLLLHLLLKIDNPHKSAEFGLMIMIILTGIIFYHPMVTLFILLILIFFEGFFLVLSGSNPGRISGDSLSIHKNFMIIFVFTIIIFIFWYTNFTSFTGTVDRAASDFLNIGQDSGPSSAFERSTDIIEKTNASLSIIIERLIKWYGPILLYITGGILCLFSIGWSLKNKKADANEVLFGGLFLCAIIFGFVLTFSFFGIGELVRTLSFAVAIVTVLIGLVISNRYDQIISGKRKMLINVILICLISFSAIFGILNIYPSPWVGIASPSMTQMEHDGFNWFLENWDAKNLLYINSASIYKYTLYAFASDPLIKDKQYVNSSELPGHFGYENYAAIPMSLTQNGYVAVREYDFTYYYAIPENLRARRAIFNDSDYNRLEYDAGINKLYTNREFEIWRLS